MKRSSNLEVTGGSYTIPELQLNARQERVPFGYACGVASFAFALAPDTCEEWLGSQIGVLAIRRTQWPSAFAPRNDSNATTRACPRRTATWQERQRPPVSQSAERAPAAAGASDICVGEVEGRHIEC